LDQLLGARKHADPPEPWEYALRRRQLIDFLRRTRIEHPYIPPAPDYVPGTALEDLKAYCGLAGPQDLFVIPRTVRRTGDGSTVLMQPTQVLGFGRDAVALWVADHEPSVPVAIPVEHIAGILDMHVLLYGKLVLHSAAQTLTVRYNTVGRNQLQHLLRPLRERISADPDAVAQVAAPGEQQRDYTNAGVPLGESERHLPYKWRLIARSQTVRLDPEAPAALFTHRRRVKKRRSGTTLQLAAITPLEVVVATEPDDYSGQYGVNTVHIPRRHIEAIQVSDDVWVRALGVQLPLPMSSRLAVTVGRALSDTRHTEVIDSQYAQNAQGGHKRTGA
jgi:hypothetical protein